MHKSFSDSELDGFTSGSGKGVLRTSEITFAEMNEAEAIGHDDDAVQSYILSNDYVKAVNLGLKRLQPYISKPFSLSPMAKNIYEQLKYIK
jgi:hypothetical protein